MGDERKTFGTLAHDAPITRDDFERALRALHLGDLEARDMLLRLAAQVVALTEELARRLPAPVDAAPGDSFTARVHAAVPAAFERIRNTDARSTPRVWLDTSLENKYELAASSSPAAPTDAPPCNELLDLCKARCCQMDFPLSTADLDEGIIRWDYGQPYLIRQRASDGFCVHNDPTTHACTVHVHRPAACRRYDCRNDSRVWIDYAKRIPAPLGTPGDGGASLEPFDLLERAKRRAAAEAIEHNAVSRVFPDDGPTTGPALAARPPRGTR